MFQNVVCTQYAAVQHAVAGFYSACRSSRARLHASLGDTPFAPRAGATRIAAVKSHSDPHEAEATILSERNRGPIKRALSTGGPTFHEAEATVLTERTQRSD